LSVMCKIVYCMHVVPVTDKNGCVHIAMVTVSLSGS